MIPSESTGPKFTPGPWTIQGRQVRAMIGGKEMPIAGAKLFIRPDGPCVTAAAPTTAMANARLIAAGPTRDALLRRLVAMAEDGFDMRDYDGAQSYGWPALMAEIKATLGEVDGA
jgi:hypothetical protein